jgi:hypothetical protein
MTYKKGKKERPQKDEKETEIVNYGGHHHNILLSHPKKKGWIGPCGLTRIIDFKVLGYYSKNYLFQNP